MSRTVNFDGVDVTVGELVSRIADSQRNIAYMTYTDRGRAPDRVYEQQRKAQEQLEMIIKLAEKEIQAVE